jgi:hypothetical protein
MAAKVLACTTRVSSSRRRCRLMRCAGGLRLAGEAGANRARTRKHHRRQPGHHRRRAHPHALHLRRAGRVTAASVERCPVRRRSTRPGRGRPGCPRGDLYALGRRGHRSCREVRCSGAHRCARQIVNSAGSASYMGPCPPSGVHHYRFTVYALSRRLALPPRASLHNALDAIAEAATAQGRLTCTYRR